MSLSITSEKKEKRVIIVNLFGVPGAGKSTGAAYIFSQLKSHGVNAELVTEFAKDKVWEDNREVFKPENQVYLFGKQFYKMERCKDKVDVIVTDSPVILSCLYNRSEVLGEGFNEVVCKCSDYLGENIYYLINRVKPYNPKGRLQTEEESDALKDPLVDILKKYNLPYKEYNGCFEDYDKITAEVLRMIGKARDHDDDEA